MNLDIFHNFAVIAESYTISDAARKLNIAQPALSTQIKNLEFYYGVQLIKMRQGSRHIELTTAGALLYKRIRHILTETESLRIEVKRVSKSEDETIMLGTTVELANQIGQYIEDFEAYMNDLNEDEAKITRWRWKLIVDNIDVLSERLENGNIASMIIPYSPTQTYLYDCQCTLSRKVRIIGRNDNDILVGKKFVRLSKLQDTPICTTVELRPSILKACREEGVDIPIYFTSSSPTAVMDMAYRKDMLAVIGGDLPSWIGDKLISVPLRSKHIRAEHYVYTRKGTQQTSATDDFVDFLKEHGDC